MRGGRGVGWSPDSGRQIPLMPGRRERDVERRAPAPLIGVGFLCTLFLLTACLGRAAGKPISTTVAAGEHPRLFFDETTRGHLQEQAASTHTDIWEPIEAFVDSQVGSLPPQMPPPDSVEDDFRNYGNRLIAFAFSCAIGGDETHCNLAKGSLLTYAGWSQWDEEGTRELGHAHLLLGSVLAYDWLYDTLSPEERQFVRQAIGARAQEVYEASVLPFRSDWDNWWRGSYAQNHHPILHSALGLAGLALLGEDERADAWVAQARMQLERSRLLLDGIGDGSWHEGIQYQNYFLTIALPFLVNLERLSGVSLFPDRYLRNYTLWRVYNSLPDSEQYILAYGDFDWSWGNGYAAQNILRLIASRYDDGRAEWMARELVDAAGRSANQWSAPWYVFEFLYYDPSIQPKAPAGLPGARVFSDLEGVVWRTGWDDDALVFGLKTGAFGGRFAFDSFRDRLPPWTDCDRCQLDIGHDHAGANGFYLYQGDGWLAPETVGNGLDETPYHNTLLVDGEGQYRPPESRLGTVPADWESDGFLETTASTVGVNYVAADATGRYRQFDGIEDVTRHVLFVRPDYFLMVDNIESSSPHRYEWVSHFGEGVTVNGDWVRGVGENNRLLGVQVVAPSPFEAETGEDGNPYVRIRGTAPVASTRLINLLYPTESTGWTARPAATLVEDDGFVTLLRVDRSAAAGGRDDILLRYRGEKAVSWVGSYEMDGTLSIVSRDAGGGLERVFLSGAAYLVEHDGTGPLVENLLSRQAIEIRYGEERLTVSAEQPLTLPGTRLYAPGVNQVVVNGMEWPFHREGEYIILEQAERLNFPFIAGSFLFYSQIMQTTLEIVRRVFQGAA